MNFDRCEPTDGEKNPGARTEYLLFELTWESGIAFVYDAKTGLPMMTPCVALVLIQVLIVAEDWLPFSCL